MTGTKPYKSKMEIARLEGTIESEGGLGLADRAAAAQEEVEAAQAALQRVTKEAATIKLLHETLEVARIETSARFVGPVARRTKRYIERLLPDCELSFSEDLALERVVRAGVDEPCEVLSHGTQEQLAILTRIAFADLLLEQGRPVSLILDDPLVYSDDGGCVSLRPRQQHRRFPVRQAGGFCGFRSEFPADQCAISGLGWIDLYGAGA